MTQKTRTKRNHGHLWLEMDLSSQKNSTNVTSVLKPKELVPQVFSSTHLNLARAGRDPGGDVVVRILTFCQLLSDVPSPLSCSSVQPVACILLTQPAVEEEKVCSPFKILPGDLRIKLTRH